MGELIKSNTDRARSGHPTRTSPVRYEPSRSLRLGGDDLDVFRLRALRALSDLEVDPLAVFESLVPVHHDRRVMDEDISAAVDGDEAIALLGVEPLDSALRHCALPSLAVARGDALLDHASRVFRPRAPH